MSELDFETDETTAPAAAEPLRASPRLRLLQGLASAALVLSVAASAAHWITRERAVEVFQPRLVWPGFDAVVEEVAALEVRSKEGAFTIVKNLDGSWGVKERGGFPVRLELLRATLWGLGDMELVEPKTTRPERHSALGLGRPEDGGDATFFRIANADNVSFLALLIGQPDGAETLSGKLRNYVAMDGDNQTWLAEGRLEPQAALEEWLDLDFLDVDADRVARAVSTPGRASEGSEPFSVERPDTQTYNFTLAGLAQGEAMTGPTAANGLGRALVALTFSDARPASDVDLASATSARFETFDGLALTLAVGRFQGDFWVEVKAQGLPLESGAGDPEMSQDAAAKIAAEVARINARADGWAFKIPEWKGGQLTVARSSLIKQEQ